MIPQHEPAAYIHIAASWVWMEATPGWTGAESDAVGRLVGWLINVWPLFDGPNANAVAWPTLIWPWTKPMPIPGPDSSTAGPNPDESGNYNGNP